MPKQWTTLRPYLQPTPVPRRSTAKPSDYLNQESRKRIRYTRYQRVIKDTYTRLPRATAPVTRVEASIKVQVSGAVTFIFNSLLILTTPCFLFWPLDSPPKHANKPGLCSETGHLTNIQIRVREVLRRSVVLSRAAPQLRNPNRLSGILLTRAPPPRRCYPTSGELSEGCDGLEVRVSVSVDSSS